MSLLQSAGSASLRALAFAGVASVALSAGPAHAAWVFLGDPFAGDRAGNYQQGNPPNQGTGQTPTELSQWLYDLTHAGDQGPTAGVFPASNPGVGGVAGSGENPTDITGLTAGYLTIHNGGGGGSLDPGVGTEVPNSYTGFTGNSQTWAFSCSTGCASFTVGDYFSFSQASNYRNFVPLPAALPLMGSALLGLWGWRRHRSRGAEGSPA